MRDSQRSKVYASEKAVPGFLDQNRHEDLAALQTYVDGVTRSEWFRIRFPRLSPAAPRGPVVTVEDGRGRRSACASGRTISVPRFARSEQMVLHEVAHVCVPYEPWGAMSADHRLSAYVPHAPHGWQFCAIYLELVRQFLGQPRHDALVAAFRSRRVQFSQKLVRRPVLQEVS